MNVPNKIYRKRKYILWISIMSNLKQCNNVFIKLVMYKKNNKHIENIQKNEQITNGNLQDKELQTHEKMCLR